MPDTPAGGVPPALIEFGSVEWGEDVERYDRHLSARTQAQSARKTIEAGTTNRDWKRRKADGLGAKKLPGCRKLYARLAAERLTGTPRLRVPADSEGRRQPRLADVGALTSHRRCESRALGVRCGCEGIVEPTSGARIHGGHGYGSLTAFRLRQSQLN
jgi:hypothetical protein